MSDTGCPQREVLRAYVLGRLDEEQLGQTADHASSCGACQTVLADLDQLTDPLIGCIRRAGALTTPLRQAAPAEATPILRPALGPEEIGRLGHYRVLGLLGQGGMGVVYVAIDTQLQRPVAVKVMRPELARQAGAGERFLREARAVAALRSEHIVTIHHVGQDQGSPFLVMELLSGESLEAWLKRGRTPALDQVLRWGREIALGLAAAHERGLIHRDVKPANVWLEGEGGRVKLLDFGLARAADGSDALTHSGLLVGTPTYMAPEQARGTGADARADLFSLGCLLYRLCTGRPAFRGEDALAVLSSLALDKPTPVRDLDPAVPPVLADLIHRLLAKDPARRPASAREVAVLLGGIERQLAAPAPPPSRSPRPGSPSRPWPLSPPWWSRRW